MRDFHERVPEREKESEQERERSCDEVLGKWRISLAYGESLSLPHKALLRVIHLSLSLSFSFSLTAYFLPLSDSFEKLLSSLFDSSLFLVVFLFYFTERKWNSFKKKKQIQGDAAAARFKRWLRLRRKSWHVRTNKATFLILSKTQQAILLHR